VYLESEMRDGKASPVVSRISVGAFSARLEVKGERNFTALIFRGDKQLYWRIDDKSKTYREITADDVSHMTTVLQSIQPQLAQSMNSMTAEQKAAVFQYMPQGTSMGSVSPSSSLKYVKKASGEKAGRWTADRYECVGAGGEIRRLWTVPKDVLNLTDQDLNVLKALVAFVDKFGTNQSDYFKLDGSALGFSGIPVKSEIVRGTRTITTEMKEAKKKNFAASVFDAPSGYAKKDMKAF
jgi:hypothetical protein